MASRSERGPRWRERLGQRQTARKNHFELLWVWRSKADYEQHLRNPATREFRARLKPLLGSPVQDRVHVPVDLEEST